MPQGQVLEFSGVTKRFGAVTAVSGLTARVEPGLVTGFLGPNGAGKTTSLRILLGLVKSTEGTATIGGARYAQLPHPLQTVGAVLEASSFHPGRTAAAHLTVYAQAAGIARSRVDEVLGLVGLSDAAGRKVGGYSLGMRQRLGLAYALLGDPGVLVLDEPTNGLDPEGIKWIRGFLRQLAREGRTVFVSSHLLAEVQQTVDALLIIAQGRLVFQGGLEELADPAEQATVVDSPDRAALADALRAADVPFEVLRSGLTVRGIEPAAVGYAAAATGVPLSLLQKRGPTLEEVFLDLVNGTRLHASASAVDDVIPAIESGPIAVVAAEDGLPDAAPDDTASIAAELDAEAAGAPAAAALGAAAVAARTDEASGRVDDEADTRPAAFAVASTGVIDIIPAGDEAGAPAEPEGPDEEPEPEAFIPPESERPATDEPGDAGDADPDVGAIAAIDDELSDAQPLEPVASDHDDRPWEDYVKTDADVEADRFFAAFDAEQAAAAAAAAEAAAREHDAGAPESGAPPEQGPEPEPEPESAPDATPDHRDEASAPLDAEGGEQR